MLSLGVVPLAVSVAKSAHAMRIRSGVAGLSMYTYGVWPAAILAARTASLIAKNTLFASRSGGSPTALDEYTARGLLEFFNSETRKSGGISLTLGIL